MRRVVRDLGGTPRIADLVENGDAVGGTTPAAGAFTTLSASGLISANGGQIAFPATQSASADANTLDDYEEGAWTPSLTFGGGSTGITYSSRNGSYTKIGRQVFIRCYILLSSKGSSTGVAAIEGLPFAGNNTADYYVVGSGGGSTFTSIVSVYPIMFAGDTKLRLFSQGTASQTQLADTNFNNTTDLGLGIHYHV